MKLEVGMYVRLQNDVENIVVINRIANVFESTILTENDGSIYQGVYTKENVIKASYSIIDILEVGDYVNGQRIYYDEELDFLYVQSFDGDGEFYQESITKQSFIDNIKSVITHEQMEQMTYKVDDI